MLKQERLSAKLQQIPRQLVVGLHLDDLPHFSQFLSIVSCHPPAQAKRTGHKTKQQTESFQQVSVEFERVFGRCHRYQ